VLKSPINPSGFTHFFMYCPLTAPLDAKKPSARKPEGLNLLERVKRFELSTHGLRKQYFSSISHK